MNLWEFEVWFGFFSFFEGIWVILGFLGGFYGGFWGGFGGNFDGISGLVVYFEGILEIFFLGVDLREFPVNLRGFGVDFRANLG